MSKATEYPGHINEDAEFVPEKPEKPETMVERVATAISNAMAEHGATPIWSDRIARAAIEAMREPSAAMIESAKAPYKYGISDTLNKAFGETINGYWRAMIDAALKE